jgi:hypothetical protein
MPRRVDRPALCLTARNGQLLDYVIFAAASVFYALRPSVPLRAAAHRVPDAQRPYRAVSGLPGACRRSYIALSAGIRGDPPPRRQDGARRRLRPRAGALGSPWYALARAPAGARPPRRPAAPAPPAAFRPTPTHTAVHGFVAVRCSGCPRPSAVAALVFAVFLSRWVDGARPGRCGRCSASRNAIREEGAEAYLARQYKTIGSAAIVWGQSSTSATPSSARRTPRAGSVGHLRAVHYALVPARRHLLGDRGYWACGWRSHQHRTAGGAHLA